MLHEAYIPKFIFYLKFKLPGLAVFLFAVSGDATFR